MGPQGPVGPAGPAGSASADDITIDQPESATNGTLTSFQLATLQASKLNGIIFANERYILQDNQHESGFLVYSHVGHDSTGNFFVKCITITISNLAWVLSSTAIGAGGDIEVVKFNNMNELKNLLANDSIIACGLKVQETIQINFSRVRYTISTEGTISQSKSTLGFPVSPSFYLFYRSNFGTFSNLQALSINKSGQIFYTQTPVSFEDKFDLPMSSPIYNTIADGEIDFANSYCLKVK